MAERAKKSDRILRVAARYGARAFLMVFVLIPTAIEAREVPVTLWISGGAEGLLDGGRIAPGWLGLLSHLGERPGSEPWIDVGGTRHFSTLAEMKSPKLPEVVVPGESLLRVGGADILQDPGSDLVISNASLLPQFPDLTLPVSRQWGWTHPDGGRVRVLGVMSETAPLRIPADRLRPLRILPDHDTVRTLYLERSEADTLEILVLPETSDPKEWSRQFPDADILVEPATGAAAVYELSSGARLRVRPAKHGRSVIRVWAKWDTVTKTFSTPRAETVWVSPPDYTGFRVPPEVSEEIRVLAKRFPLEGVDAVWAPDFEKVDRPTMRPDSIRAQRVPEDDAWMKIKVPASRWPTWSSVPEARWEWTGDARRRSPTVVLPARVVAGRGDWDCPIRQDILKGVVKGRWLSATTRDFLEPPSDISSQ